MDSRPILQKELPQLLHRNLKKNCLQLSLKNQTAYVKNGFLSKSDRLITDIVDVCDIENIPGYFVARSWFSHMCFGKMWLGDNFIKWVIPLLNTQEPFVLNRGQQRSILSQKKVQVGEIRYLHIYLKLL